MRALLLISAAVLGWFFLHWLHRRFTTWRLRDEYNVMYGKLWIGLADVRQKYDVLQSALHSASGSERHGLSSATLEQIEVELGGLCDLNPHPADKLLPEFVEKVEGALKKLDGIRAAIEKAKNAADIQPASPEDELEIVEEMSDSSSEVQERSPMFADGSPPGS